MRNLKLGEIASRCIDITTQLKAIETGAPGWHRMCLRYMNIRRILRGMRYDPDMIRKKE